MVKETDNIDILPNRHQCHCYFEQAKNTFFSIYRPIFYGQPMMIFFGMMTENIVFLLLRIHILSFVCILSVVNKVIVQPQPSQVLKVHDHKGETKCIQKLLRLISPKTNSTCIL